MPRKLKYEEVKYYIEIESKSDCKLLSKEYINASTKLKIQCKCGSNFEVTLNGFKSANKRQCNICSGHVYDSYDKVKEYIEIDSNSGCKLLSKEYNNNRQKLVILCKCGNEFKTTFASFRHKNKTQCNQCSLSKYTYDYVKNFIEKESNSGCELLDNKYKNTSQKLNIKCGCGNVFKTAFRDFKFNMKRRCSDCSSRKFTYQEVKNFIEVESNSGCKLLSNEYEGCGHKLDIICSCGQVFTTDYHQFKHMNKRQCNDCGWGMIGDKLRHGLDDVRAYIKSNTDMELISTEYNNLSNNILVRCGDCENIFKTTFGAIKYKTVKRCPECALILNAVRRRIGYKKIKTYIESESECKLLTPFKKNLLVADSIELRCKCGNIFTTSFIKFRDRGKRQCSECGYKEAAPLRLKDPEFFKKEVYDLIGDEYVVLDEYKNAKTKVKMRHNICEHVWDILPNSFLDGQRCPQCNSSKGELDILTYLQNYNISFVREYSFENLFGVNGGLLRFDFVLFDNTNNLKLLIEYDGEFHFKKFYDDQNYETLQIHDKRKNQYCKENNIPLIRIPYWQFDKIEQILDKWLSKYEII